MRVSFSLRLTLFFLLSIPINGMEYSESIENRPIERSCRPVGFTDKLFLDSFGQPLNCSAIALVTVNVCGKICIRESLADKYEQGAATVRLSEREQAYLQNPTSKVPIDTHIPDEKWTSSLEISDSSISSQVSQDKTLLDIPSFEKQYDSDSAKIPVQYGSIVVFSGPEPVGYGFFEIIEKAIGAKYYNQALNTYEEIARMLNVTQGLSIFNKQQLSSLAKADEVPLHFIDEYFHNLARYRAERRMGETRTERRVMRRREQENPPLEKLILIARHGSTFAEKEDIFTGENNSMEIWLSKLLLLTFDVVDINVCNDMFNSWNYTDHIEGNYPLISNSQALPEVRDIKSDFVNDPCCIAKTWLRCLQAESSLLENYIGHIRSILDNSLTVEAADNMLIKNLEITHNERRELIEMLRYFIHQHTPPPGELNSIYSTPVAAVLPLFSSSVLSMPLPSSSPVVSSWFSHSQRKDPRAQYLLLIRDLFEVFFRPHHKHSKIVFDKTSLDSLHTLECVKDEVTWRPEDFYFFKAKNLASISDGWGANTADFAASVLRKTMIHPLVSDSGPIRLAASSASADFNPMFDYT